jgi:tripartite-type tricarboxylate transporter receptor subunit TctC
MRLVVALLALILAAPASAETWPARPIRLMVPFAPGGGTDILARTIAPQLQGRLGQPLVIENKPGAGSTIGSDIVAKAPADGYTLLMVDTSFTVNPSLYAKLPYDSEKDFAPVALLAGAPVILLVHPSVPAQSVAELVALAKAKPGQLYYASGGNGASTHLGGELLKLVAGIDVVHVPYKGTGPAVTDLLGGQVQMMFTGISSGKQHVASGALRALAVTGAQRNKAMPEVPTFAESGLAGVDAGTYWALLAPAGTPAEIVERLNRELDAVLHLPELRGRAEELGYDVLGGPPARLADNLRSETAKWAEVVHRAGIKLD